MNYSDYRFTLDIQIHRAQVSVPATLGDTARKLCIGLIDGRKSYTIADGCYAVLNAKLPDDSKNPIVHYCIIERNTIIYEFSQNITSAAGLVNCEITLYDADGRKITSPKFIIAVDEKVVRDEEIPISDEEASAIGNIIRTEASRISVEKKRKESENLRVDAENSRIDAEVLRAEAELTRIANETQRSDAETSRTKAENLRADADKKRQVNDATRQSNEEQRLIAEGSTDPESEYYGGRALAEKQRAGLGLIVKNGKVYQKYIK